MPTRPAFRRLIAADIIEKINNGTYPPGSQLPYDGQLAAEYGCSIGPVKAALDELSIRGYVERQQGKGTFVAAHPPTP
jgi:DNA-binding GntR family transcriptional regulator